MNILQAKPSDFEKVKEITHKTITQVYPHYYPAGTVLFFLKHHSDESISSDISEGRVFLLYTDSREAAGTVTVKGSEICRLFVLPEYQGRGYGARLMGYAEALIAESSDEITADSSLPARTFYLKLGYKEAGYHNIKTFFGDHLCYDVMKKSITDDIG